MSNLTDPTKATNPEQKKALGRGLAALINPALKSTVAPANTAQANTEAPQASVPNAKLELVELKQIFANPNQPRKVFDQERLNELSESLKAQGLVQPIVVRRQGDHYEIIAGERRWRAAKLAQFEKIPVIIRDDKSGELQNDLASLVENLQREQLSPLELATAYERMISVHTMTQEQLAERVGVSRVNVANHLRLLKLPQDVKDLLAAGKITEGHARSLLSLDNEKSMGEAAKKIVEGKLSVREAEQQVRSIKANEGLQAAAQQKAQEQQKMAGLEEELRRLFGTKVAVRNSKGRGTIEIYFTGEDSLNRIIHQLRALNS